MGVVAGIGASNDVGAGAGIEAGISAGADAGIRAGIGPVIGAGIGTSSGVGAGKGAGTGSAALSSNEIRGSATWVSRFVSSEGARAVPGLPGYDSGHVFCRQPFTTCKAPNELRAASVIVAASG